jgi:hypothetical protein
VKAAVRSTEAVKRASDALHVFPVLASLRATLTPCPSHPTGRDLRPARERGL